MLDFLQSLADIIQVAFNALYNVLLGLFQFLLHLPQFVSAALGFVAYVPSFAVVYFIAGISITVLLLVINRRAE